MTKAYVLLICVTTTLTTTLACCPYIPALNTSTEQAPLEVTVIPPDLVQSDAERAKYVPLEEAVGTLNLLYVDRFYDIEMLNSKRDWFTDLK